MVRFCDGVLSALECPRCVLTVCFVSADRIRDLNKRHRGRDYPTDVMSFGYENETIDGCPFLGEIVISPEIAFSQARRWRTTGERELRRLLIHGVLHLMGYDHETDSGEMIRLQQRLLRRRAVTAANVITRARGE